VKVTNRREVIVSGIAGCWGWNCVFVCFSNMDSWTWTDRTATECSHGIIDDKFVI